VSDQVTVLIIDDEIHIRRLIGRMLEGAGFKAIETGSGKQALTILRDPENRPDIITCDIAMPDMNGFDILHTIKNDPELCHIPVIMLTAMGQLEEAGRAKKMGASDYITKPFSAISLIDILREQVKKSREQVEESS